MGNAELWALRPLRMNMAGLILYISRTNLLAELVSLQGRCGSALFGFGDECGESGIAM
jgi:hypothetical protein